MKHDNITSRSLWVIVGIAAIVFAACGPAATPVSATPTVSKLIATAQPSPTPTALPTAAPAGPRTGGTIRHPLETDPETWDPSRDHGTIAFPKYMVFTKLISEWPDPPQNCKQKPHPLGVESWRWVDDVTAEFALRPGMTFHNRPPANGREVVAQDVVTTYQRNKGLPVWSARVAQVESVTSVDKYAFRIRLKGPWGGLVQELVSYRYGMWVEPAELSNLDAETWGNRPEKAWVGSGPFLFESWVPGVKTRLVRNPAYWARGRPYVAAVEYLVIPDAMSQFAALVGGKLDMVRHPPEEVVGAAVRSVPGIQVVRCPGLGVQGAGILYLNTKGPPLNDVRVRRAISMAIEKEAMVKTLYSGKATAFPFLPPSVRYAMALEDYPPDVRRFLEHRPEEAKRLLSEAGYSSGLDLVLNVPGYYLAPTSMVGEAIAEGLRNIGIRVKLNMLDRGRWTGTISANNWTPGELGIGPRNALSAEDPLGFPGFSSTLGGRINRSNINVPEYDRLVGKFMASNDDSERDRLAREIQTMIAREVYAVALPFPDSVMLASPRVHFTWLSTLHEYSMFMETVWMD